MTSPTIEFLFLTYNRLGIVSRCFKSLLPLLLDNEQISWRILDNGSQDGTANWLIKLVARYPRIDLRLSALNLGVAGGRQYLLERSTSDIIAFMDTDVEALTPDWIVPLLTALEDRQVGAAGPGGHFLMPGWKRFAPAVAVGTADVVAGYCQFLRREVLDGFTFDPFFNPYFHEDSDMCLWLRSRGYTIWHTGDIGLRHIFANSANATSEDEHRKQAHLAQKWAGNGLVAFEQEGLTS